MDILEKINIFTNEESIGTRPIQFMKNWNDFRVGDRADIEVNDDSISVIGSDGTGNFAGAKKEVTVYDEIEIDLFINSRRNIWNYI